MNIQISNLGLNVIERDLQRLFKPYGDIHSIIILRDKLSNRSTGRGYIDMPNHKQAEEALAQLHLSELDGKKIRLEEVGSLEDIRNRTSNF